MSWELQPSEGAKDRHLDHEGPEDYDYDYDYDYE